MAGIRSAIERTVVHLAADPEAGRGPDAPATAVIDEALRIRVDGPNGSAVTDMSAAVGGGAGAPTPGWLLRAGLASCDATTVAMEAARAGIELTELAVTVESDSDSRGALGVGDTVPPGPLAVRVRISLAASNASAEELRELALRAEARSPVRDALTREIPVTTEVVV